MPKISLVVFMPNMTTNHAITYNNNKNGELMLQRTSQICMFNNDKQQFCKWNFHSCTFGRCSSPISVVLREMTCFAVVWTTLTKDPFFKFSFSSQTTRAISMTRNNGIMIEEILNYIFMTFSLSLLRPCYKLADVTPHSQPISGKRKHNYYYVADVSPTLEEKRMGVFKLPYDWFVVFCNGPIIAHYPKNPAPHNHVVSQSDSYFRGM